MEYTCPMHPHIRREHPGMCPECGMALVRITHPSGGHGASHHADVFRRKFLISLALTVPILAYSPLWEMIFGVAAPNFPGSSLLAPLLGTAVFLIGGWVFLSGARRELAGKPGMMMLISLAIIASYGYSMAQAVRGQSETLFWELATLIDIMLLGHWLEMRAVSGAQGALKELSKLLPDTAEVEQGGIVRTVPLAQIRVGDIVIVRPGGRVAADGEVVGGVSDIDESLVTGESSLVHKEIGDRVIAGTINAAGSLRIRVTNIGEKTFLSGVMRLVEQAQASKSKLQVLADRAALYLTIIAVVAGLCTLAIWAPLRGADFALRHMVAVLVIACPHALGLAIPLVASISTTLASRNGFLVRQRLALEESRRADVVLFDKTGTLTRGVYGVTDMHAIHGTPEELLRLAASVDAMSEHPAARAIVLYAKKQSISVRPARNFRALKGKGAYAEVDGKGVYVGGSALLFAVREDIASEVRSRIEAYGTSGKTVLYVISDGRLLGVFALGDHIRQESRDAVRLLKQQGIRVAMVTGDAAAVAAWVAGELGIEEYTAQVLPGQKADMVKRLQERGARVMMVGDGINDAPALAQADVGVAIGAGTNVAIEAAGIVLVKNDPRDIPKIIELSKRTYAKMIQNMLWATGYNSIALPLAAGIAVPWGIVLTPAVSAVLMSLSTVIVAGNAMLLRYRSGVLYTYDR